MLKISKFIGNLFAVALFCTNSLVHAAIDNKPSSQAEQIYIGADIRWTVKHDSISKTAEGQPGEYYRLSFDGKHLSLQVGVNNQFTSNTKQYAQLIVEDLLVDGERLPIFQWCLNHQTKHDRYLQPGLDVQNKVCEIQGERGTFAVKLDRITSTRIESAQRLSFIIRPHRTSLRVNYDISDYKQAIAIQQAQLVESAAAKVSVGTVSKPGREAVQPDVKIAPVQVKMCKAKASGEFSFIGAVEYVCNDSADKKRAQQKMAFAIDKEKKRKQAAQLAARETQQKATQQRLKLEQEKQAEQEAIAKSREKHQQVLNELTKKMVGVCNKMWALGKHRCYCERYIQYAPAGIESDPFCSE